MPLENWIQHCKVAQFLYDWQTIIAGVLALLAAIITIWETRRIADRQIATSGEDAKKVIAATREQTETTVRLERERVTEEAKAFHFLLEAAMARVLADANAAKEDFRGAGSRL